VCRTEHSHCARRFLTIHTSSYAHTPPFFFFLSSVLLSSPLPPSPFSSSHCTALSSFSHSLYTSLFFPLYSFLSVLSTHALHLTTPLSFVLSHRGLNSTPTHSATPFSHTILPNFLHALVLSSHLTTLHTTHHISPSLTNSLSLSHTVMQLQGKK
jgi:hypothetical protein